MGGVFITGWNGPELVKAITGLALPLIVAYLAYIFNQRLQDIQRQQWYNQQLLRKRVEVFDKLAPDLNDIYCYLRFRGNWKDISPVQDPLAVGTHFA